MKNFLLLFSSLVMALLLAEATVRFFWVPNSINVSRTEFSNHGYLLNPNTGVGWQKIGKTTIACHYYPPHLRDTPPLSTSKKILVLGDSFTFGWMLPWQSTYIYHLQKASNEAFGKNHFQFLNAAVGGWGAADFLAYLKEYGKALSPAYVLIFLNTDDIGRAMQRNIFQLSDPTGLQLTEQYHPLRYVPLRKFLFNNRLYEHSTLYQFLRNNLSLTHLTQAKTALQQNKSDVVIPMSTELDFQDAFAIRYGQALFLAIQMWCEEHHAKLLVVTTGFNAFYPANIHEPTQVFLAQAKSFFAKTHIAYDDIAPAYQAAVTGKAFQIPIDHHPNPLGAATIADLSWPWIKNQLG